jgi:hypothetical protein
LCIKSQKVKAGNNFPADNNTNQGIEMKFKIYLNKEAIYKGTITCVGWSSNNEVFSCG